MFLRHLRSNAIAYVALTVALGGTSYAAVKLPKASVGTKQLKANAVTSAKVKNQTLRLGDFKLGQIPSGSAGPEGKAGPAGAIGPAGAPGKDGQAGATGALGPTYSFQSIPTGPVSPSSTPQVALAERTLTLPSAGRLFVYGHSAITMDCTSAGTPQIALYLDGVGIPGTARELTPTVATTSEFSGLTGPVSAGARTLSVEIDCLGGAINGAFNHALVFGGILVGG